MKARWEVFNSTTNRTTCGAAYSLAEAKRLVEGHMRGLERNCALATYCKAKVEGGPVWKYDRSLRGLGWTWRKASK